MSKNFRFTALVCLLCLSMLFVCSCEGISDSWKIVRLTGEPKTVTVPLEDDGSGIGLAVDLNFTGGGDNTVTVLPPADGEAPYAVLTYPSDLDEMGFTAGQKDGVLTVEVPQNCQFTAEAFSVTVYANVTAYDLTGSYTLHADLADRETDVLRLHIAGGAAVKMNGIAAEAVVLDVDGAADVVLAGASAKLDAEINGACVLEAAALTVQHGAVIVNGVGTARVSCSETLDAKINGAGSISYVGDPTLTKEINGLGSIAKLSEETT